MPEEQVLTNKDYCTQNNEDCATCSLSSYGTDCHGKPIQEQSGGPFPCPMCQGQKYIQAFADTNGVCPRCGGAKFVDTLEY